MTEIEIRERINQLNISSETILNVLINENGASANYFGKIEFDLNDNPVVNDEIIGIRIQVASDFPFYPYKGGLKISNLINFIVYA